jgi:hypothetical protein
MSSPGAGQNFDPQTLPASEARTVIRAKTVRASEIANLRKDVEVAEQQGRDLLAELAVTVGEQVARARKEYEALAKEAKKSGRQI